MRVVAKSKANKKVVTLVCLFNKNLLEKLLLERDTQQRPLDWTTSTTS